MCKFVILSLPADRQAERKIFNTRQALTPSIIDFSLHFVTLKMTDNYLFFNFRQGFGVFIFNFRFYRIVRLFKKNRGKII